MEKLSEVAKDAAFGYDRRLWKTIRIETKSGAGHVIWNERSFKDYIDKHGDVEVEWDSEREVYRRCE